MSKQRQMKPKVVSRVLVEHSKKCFAIEAVKRGTWTTPWSGIITYNYFGNVLGHRTNTGRLWHIISCNDPSCKAEKAIIADVLCHA